MFEYSSCKGKLYARESFQIGNHKKEKEEKNEKTGIAYVHIRRFDEQRRRIVIALSCGDGTVAVMMSVNRNTTQRLEEVW